MKNNIFIWYSRQPFAEKRLLFKKKNTTFLYNYTEKVFDGLKIIKWFI